MRFEKGIDPRLLEFPTLDLSGDARLSEEIGPELSAESVLLDKKGGRAGVIEAVDDLGESRLWEVVGPDWALRSRFLNHDITLRAEGDFFSFQDEARELLVSYGRGFGRLRIVYLGISSLIRRAAEDGDGLATRRDLMIAASLRGDGLDFGLSLVFFDDGPRIVLSKVSLAGGEIKFFGLRLEEMVVNSCGSIGGEPDFSWEGKVGRFDDRVRVEVASNEVLISLVSPNGEAYQAHRIRRELNGVSLFDQLGQNRKLTAKGLNKLGEEIFGK